MTNDIRYTQNMQLLFVQWLGALYSVCILLVCTAAVFGARLARIGWRTLHKKLPPDPPPKNEKKAEPVYFIVERKKKRVKPEYSDPRRIDFK